MLWASNNGRKDGSGSIITGETGLAHTGSVIADKGSNFVIHFREFLFVRKLAFFF
jgi:hypothetical protein